MPDADTPQQGDSSEQKRFIRTFAADMEAVQAGETPDLKPLEPSKTGNTSTPQAVEVTPAPEPPQAPAQTSQQTPAPQAPVPSPTPAAEPEEDKEAVLARLRAKVAASTETKAQPQAAPAPTPATPPAQKTETPTSSPIHTYSSDFSEKVQDTHASTASILAAQQDAGPAPKAPTRDSHSRSGLLFVISGIVLLLLGGAGAYAAYLAYQNRPLPVVVAPTVTAPIFVDERTQLSGTSTALETAIVQSAATPLASDGVRFLYTVTSTSTDQSVFSALQLPAPSILLRNIDATGSMAGIVQLHGVPSVFFILSVQSYSDTFAGMLSWEGTMARDLARLFPPYPTNTATSTVATTTTATSSVASSTPQATSSTTPTQTDTGTFSVLYKPGFFDEVVASHDARAYRDTAGKTLFIYSYANPNTLIIARNEEALTEILSRISTSRSK